MLDAVTGDARIIVNDLFRFQKINNDYFTYYPSDNYLEKGINFTYASPSELKAENFTPSTNLQKWAILWSVATLGQRAIPKFLIEQQLNYVEGDAQIILNDNISFQKIGNTYFTIKDGVPSEGIQGIVVDGNINLAATPLE